MLCSQQEQLARAYEISPTLFEIRRAIHRYPELGFEEHRTANLVARYLLHLGLDVQTGIGGTGVVALLRGKKRDPVVCLRADMDALSINEETGLPYASTIPGKMHACGHDLHCAAVLGAAYLLREYSDSLPGSVKFIFQPAEETDTGARAMLDAGALSDPEPHAIFGIHVWPELKVGKVAIQPGPIMAAIDSFDITITGALSHAALPNEGCDAILAGSLTVVNLQQVVARNLDPRESAVVTVGTFQAGRARNIIADAAVLSGTVRTLSHVARMNVEQRIREIVTHSAAACGAAAMVKYEHQLPTLVNSEEMCEIAARSAETVLGPGCLQSVTPSMAGDDFAFYLNRVPGCYILVGASSNEKVSPLHSCRFNPDESLLPLASALLARICLDFLGTRATGWCSGVPR